MLKCNPNMNFLRFCAVEWGDSCSAPCSLLCSGGLLILVTGVVFCGYLNCKRREDDGIKYFYREDLNTNIQYCNYVEQLCRV